MEITRPTSFSKDRINVLLLEGIHPQARRVFEEEGYPVESSLASLAERDLKEKVPDVFVLGIRSRTQVTQGVLEKAPRLIAVGAFCIGTEQIDINAASNSGVAVFNAPHSNTRSVAELALGYMITLQRGVIDKNQKMHLGVWEKSARGAREIRGKTLGIIGYGKIGSQLSVLAESLGMNVCYYNTSETLSFGNARKTDSMEEVLQAADVVSVHVSGKPVNRNLFSAAQFETMKDGAIFLNLSRGFVVDQDALAEYLRTGKLKGAAIDVFVDEPESNDQEFHSPLRGLSNVILTPHIGGSTEEAQEDIARFVSTKLVTFINTGDTRLSVNLPSTELPPQADSHRILHLHRNIPGVMAHINGILADRGINIAGQYLRTNEDVGYVITDVNKVYDRSVLRQLREVEGTIKLRVLY